MINIIKQKIRRRFSYATAAYIAIATVILGLLMPAVVFASGGELLNRSLALSTSAGNTSSTWTFTFDDSGSHSVLKGMTFEVCDAASGTCNIPGSWTNAGSSFASLSYNGSGQSGWTIDNAAGYLRIHNASASNSSTANMVVTFNTVTNPNTTNATFYVRVLTFTDSTYSTQQDNGVVAASTAQQISLTGTMDESLVFCVGTTITGQNCGTISGSSINFGSFSSGSTSTGTSVMAASTNGLGGYTITVNGGTMTCTTCGGSPPSIAALASQTASSVGNPQFGLNLRVNATPSFGADPTGGGSGSYSGNYGTANQYRFVTADSVASAAGSTNANTFTSAYIVNVPGSQAPGTYQATMTYICTAKF